MSGGFFKGTLFCGETFLDNEENKGTTKRKDPKERKEAQGKGGFLNGPAFFFRTKERNGERAGGGLETLFNF